MERYPISMMNFMDMFPTEDACLEYLRLIRWPEGYECQHCSSKDAWKMSSGLYRCQVCHYTGSIIAGTLFQDSHKPLRLWFIAMWYVVNQKYGVSALGLQKALNLGSYHTAWEWLQKLRRAMVRPNRDRLSGVIEVNETFIGGERTGRRGRGAEGKSLVLVAAEKVDNGNAIGRIRLSKIPDASAETLTQAIEQTVKPGSTIYTDGWNGYSSLEKHGYAHQPRCQQDIKLKDSIPDAHLVASLLKRWLLGKHQGAVSHKHLPYYLDEFTFRFNRRTSKSRGKLFYRLVEQAIQIDPVPGKCLV